MANYLTDQQIKNIERQVTKLKLTQKEISDFFNSLIISILIEGCTECPPELAELAQNKDQNAFYVREFVAIAL